MRVLFCGGGTAGHVNPALAVANTVVNSSNDNKVAYVATTHGIENKLVPFKKYQIDVIGFKRKISFKNVSFFCKQLQAVEKCKKIIKEFHPDVVFGTGGYATYPVVVAAKKLGIKVVLHESNVIPGKAMISLQKKADKILVNFEESKKYFKKAKEVIKTGNPIREDFVTCTKQIAKNKLKIMEKFVVLCTGGSLGAERINNAAIEITENFIRHRKDVLFVWATGKRDYERVADILKSKGIYQLQNLVVRDYFDNMPHLMVASDIVISRAGAMTISELAYSKKAAILIPSPNVTKNHQYINAEALEKAGAAIVVTEDKLFTLIDELKELLDNASERKKLESSISAYSVSDSNRRIYDILYNIV